MCLFRISQPIERLSNTQACNKEQAICWGYRELVAGWRRAGLTLEDLLGDGTGSIGYIGGVLVD